MQLPERFAHLPDYAFARLGALLEGIPPGAEPRVMTIGEPRRPVPDWLPDALAEAAGDFARYPPNPGAPELLAAISDWTRRRYGASLSPERIMALSGTREGLFNAGLALGADAGARRPVVLMPNPFYQVYAAAAAAIGAEPVFVPALEEDGYLPDYAALPPETLERATLAYVCSPSNPQGAVAPRGWLRDLLALAERHDFRVLSDECYSEIYRGDPPPGILEVADADPERALAFHSLSKRSGLPGLRSGFVAGGSGTIAAMRKLRSYGGAPLPGPIGAVSARLWADEAHVEAARAHYARNFAVAARVLDGVPGVRIPEAGFFLWLPVGARDGHDAEAATRRLWRDAGVKVLPGHFLARGAGGVLPGRDRVRVALVDGPETCADALTRLRACLYDG